jgi:chemotaxis signal transduction protein
LREVGLNDRFIIVTTAHRKLALIVDDVEDVLSPDSQDWFDSKEINKGLKFLNILRDDQGIIFIYDIESLLGMDEEIQLKKLLETNFFN